MERQSREEMIRQLDDVSKDSETKKELIRLLDKLSAATFRGVGIGKYYPAGSGSAYYRMEYSPNKMVLRHKSPSFPIEERFEVAYKSEDDFNPVSLTVYAGEQLHRSCVSKKEIEDFIELGRLMIVYLFKDPRVVLFSAEKIGEIPPIEGFDKAYRVLALDFANMAQMIGETEYAEHCKMFGPSVTAEFYLKEGWLKMMRLRIFMGQKEIYPQNTDIAFQF